MKLLLGMAAATAAALVLAPSASADPQTFLDDLYDHGWYSHGGDSNLVASGYRVCSMLNTTTGYHVAQYIYNNTGLSVSAADAVEFVVLSVQDLCPWHDHRTQGAV